MGQMDLNCTPFTQTTHSLIQSPHLETSFQEDMASTQFQQSTHIERRTKTKMLKEYELKMGKAGNKRPLSRIPLWYFLHEILEVERCRDLIQWEDESNLVFSIKKPKELAVLWGQIKDKETMTYPKLARGIRYYYGKGVIEKFNGKRFCYKFIVSRKTRAVLSKRKNIPPEVEIPKMSTSKNNKKRKLPYQRSLDTLTKLEPSPKRLRGRRNTDTSLDSNGCSPSNASSDWDDDEESFSESDWGNFDDILNEVLEAPTLCSIFGNIKNEAKPENDDQTFIMNSTPPELNGVLSTINTFTTTTQCLPLNTISTTTNPFMRELTELAPSTNIYNLTSPLSSTANTTTSLKQVNVNSNCTTPTSSFYPSNFDSKFLRRKFKSDSDRFSSSYNDPYSVYTPMSELERKPAIYSSLPDITSYQQQTNIESSDFLLANYLLEQNFLQDVSVDSTFLDNFL